MEQVVNMISEIPQPPLRRQYESLRDQSRLEVAAGRFEAALDLLDNALAVARNMGDEDLVAMARCNKTALALATGRPGDHIADLRSILMRNYDVMTSFMAAYNLSYAYELKKEFKKALFYGRVARDRASAAESPEHLASSYSQIGNGLLGSSYFEEAKEHYEKALALLPDEQTYVTVPAHINLGYCLVMLGQVRPGFRLLFRSLRWLRPRGMRSMQVWAHLFTCAGYLELGRVRRAWVHGRKALAFAYQTGEQDAIKTTLFMMGEVERSGGDIEAAFGYFARIQKRFFPDQNDAPALLSVVSMAKVVNLRA